MAVDKLLNTNGVEQIVIREIYNSGFSIRPKVAFFHYLYKDGMNVVPSNSIVPGSISVAGYYDPTTLTVNLALQNHTYNQFEHTVRHEYGHFIYDQYYCLSMDLFKLMKEVFLEYVNDPTKIGKLANPETSHLYYVSGFANSESLGLFRTELFAESYALYRGNECQRNMLSTHWPSMAKFFNEEFTNDAVAYKMEVE